MVLRLYCAAVTLTRPLVFRNGHSAFLLFISAVCRESWKIMGELLKSVGFVRNKRKALSQSEQTELAMRRG